MLLLLTYLKNNPTSLPLREKKANSQISSMGGTFSEPIPNVGDVGYVAIVVLQHDKLRLLHCPPNVREMVHNTIR